MSISIEFFEDIFSKGMSAIPVKWEGKEASKYPLGRNPSFEDVSEMMGNGWAGANGAALILYPPFGMFDFDLKHTAGKDVFSPWLASLPEDTRRKICIEQTRNGGYHAYIKYDKLVKKIALARNADGEEVISVYTGGLLSFCSPTPGYNFIHNDLNDLEELTDAEFNHMVDLAKAYNEDALFIPGERVIKLIDYPVEYAYICKRFDNECPDELFEKMIAGLKLYPTDAPYNEKYGYDKYLRAGSKQKFSAKVYRGNKFIQIFSGSIKGFPCFADRESEDDHSFNLTPSKLVYYYFKEDWVGTIDKIKSLLPPDPYFENFELVLPEVNTEDDPRDEYITARFWEEFHKADKPVNMPDDQEDTYNWYWKLIEACPRFVESIYRKIGEFIPTPAGVIAEGDYFSDAVYENLPPKLKVENPR